MTIEIWPPGLGLPNGVAEWDCSPAWYLCLCFEAFSSAYRSLLEHEAMEQHGSVKHCFLVEKGEIIVIMAQNTHKDATLSQE